MNDSDRRYLSRFALDPTTMEYRWEDLYGFDFSCPYDEMDPFDDENILNAEDTIPKDDFLFEN